MLDSTQRHLKVFLCHASADKPTVRELYHQLNAEGWIDAWLDEIKLLPGQEWDMEIEKAVEDADVVIVCISTRSVDKEGHVQKELRYVLNIADEKPEGSIFVIPLKLDDCIVPRRLRAWQWVDYFPADQKPFAYKRLLESLKVRAKRLGISFDKPEPKQQHMVGDEGVAVKNEPKPSRPELVGFPNDKYSDEKKIEKQHLNQTRRTPEKRKALLNPKVRLFIGVASVLLLVPLCIMGGANYISNNLLEFITVTPTNQLSTRLVSDMPETAAVFDTETAIAVSTEVISPTPTLDSGSNMISDKDGMTLLYVPAGEFTMGSDDSGFDNEKPAHTVYLDAFWIDQTEVTNKQYAMCVSVSECSLPSSLKSPRRSSGYYSDPRFEDYPVIYIDWFMAKTYCEWTGWRLPTEAEWEKAARGTDGRVYPWGNDVPNGNLLNYNSYWTDTSVVRQYPAGKSFYGAYDMAGNVWEWTSSLYMPYPYDATDGRENQSAKRERVLRGGSWYYVENSSISISRYGVIPVDFLVRSDVRSWTSKDGPAAPYGYGTIGFRCAMNVAL